ncbi:hypothetical protein M0R45_009103 [Rubus argutus]|uniref:Uncharacterized protein n=1 Tax=Rubus argutus TaxID=59490 RepID=A0AAW1Y517_RUBAR
MDRSWMFLRHRFQPKFTQEDEIVSDGEGNEDDNALMFDMLNDVQGPINMEMEDEEASDKDMSNGANKYDYLFGEAQRELYPDSHPEGATVPESHYKAKKMLRELGLGYESIHACKNDCALFWKENEKLDKCPECNELRYKSNDGKRKKVPQKVLRYFPLKPRLKSSDVNGAECAARELGIRTAARRFDLWQVATKMRSLVSSVGNEWAESRSRGGFNGGGYVNGDDCSFREFASDCGFELWQSKCRGVMAG